MQRVQLAPHPDNRDTPLSAIGVSARRTTDKLHLSYTITGDIARLRAACESLPGIGRELWKHTCCECFITVEGEPGYYEFNFSPSRQWAAYVFSNYREGAPLTDETLDPRIAVRRFGDHLELDASIALDRLSACYVNGALRIGLSAVIEDTEGGLSYWALAHLTGQPDFHHRDDFALRIPSIS